MNDTNHLSISTSRDNLASTILPQRGHIDHGRLRHPSYTPPHSAAIMRDRDPHSFQQDAPEHYSHCVLTGNEICPTIMGVLAASSVVLTCRLAFCSPGP